MTETAVRNASLKRMLIERRRGMRDEVQGRIRDGRTDRPMEVRDDLEDSDAGIREDLDFALLQMSAETLARIDEALGRLAAGTYGSCSECEGEIAERRLQALPFAVRCRACEERLEQELRHHRPLAHRAGGASLFANVVGS